MLSLKLENLYIQNAWFPGYLSAHSVTALEAVSMSSILWIRDNRLLIFKTLPLLGKQIWFASSCHPSSEEVDYMWNHHSIRGILLVIWIFVLYYFFTVKSNGIICFMEIKHLSATSDKIAFWWLRSSLIISVQNCSPWIIAGVNHSNEWLLPCVSLVAIRKGEFALWLLCSCSTISASFMNHHPISSVPSFLSFLITVLSHLSIQIHPFFIFCDSNFLASSTSISNASLL